MVAVGGTSNGIRWHLAPCLVALYDEADQRDPDRDTRSDGTIGNAEHAARASDHNPAPDEGTYWVCAADIDDDDDQANPGVDLLRAHLVASKDPRVKYLIRNGTIWKAYENRGLPPWTPQVYTGLNDHSHHLHISVWNTAEARNDTRPWWPTEEDIDMATGDEIMAALEKLDGRLHAIELRQIELDDDIPENLTAKVEQIQRNVRRIGAAVNAEGIEA